MCVPSGRSVGRSRAIARLRAPSAYSTHCASRSFGNRWIRFRADRCDPASFVADTGTPSGIMFTAPWSARACSSTVNACIGLPP